jgi:hypothetical protein
MSCDHVLIRQLDLEGSVGQRLNDNAFKLDYIVLRQKNPSLHIGLCATVQNCGSISVKISTLSPISAMVFS